MKLKKIIIMALCLSLVMTCGVFLAACNKGGGEGGGDTYVPRNSNQWFTEAELAKKGLSALPAPTGLTGTMTTDVAWLIDGYYFAQPCPNEEVFYENVEKYFAYFKKNYDGRFGTDDLEKILTADKGQTCYRLVQETNLDKYYVKNSKRYRFYYATDTEATQQIFGQNYLKDDAVWLFEVMYDFDTTKNTYVLKIFIENAGKAKNGETINYYRLAEK